MAVAVPIGIGLWELAQGALIALGIVATAKTVDNAIKARSAAQSGAATTTTTVTRCPQCPARNGMVMPVNHHMSPDARLYQAHVNQIFGTGIPPGSEWVYMGVDFDGFQSATCTLLETKAKYEQFLDPGSNYTRWRYWYEGDRDFLSQALRQKAVAQPCPPILLHWHFLQLLVKQFAEAEFLTAGLQIQCFLTP
ncbi:hypothetical protein CYFUS_002511 [Cystobacter fuscus]|uniref:Tox-REase-5 domain-containing protein n=1 Tax=Cystobacter fuscus TaxID=43 RepID=A0A250J0P7_9BACT|nr:restriction endonuclease fold toxin 5 domain-containing protein [Cystobacter fuscus]ATB37090.1 hypothetical protein CYFUS_002511 [Cystobacter fuscus]